VIYTAQNPVWNRKVISEMLAALSTVPLAALLTAPKVRLLGSAISIDQDTPMSALTSAEATYTGYVAVALPALVGPVNSVPGMEALFGSVSFVAPSPLTVTGILYGYFVDGVAGATWAIAESFPSPFPFALPGDFLDLDLLLGLYFQNRVS